MNSVHGLTFFVHDKKLVEMKQDKDFLQKMGMEQINGLRMILTQ